MNTDPTCNRAPIYLDGFATMPLAPEAREAMLAAWDRPGNAASPNRAGERAACLVAEGRSAVADLIGAAPSEIIFTSGATEANNLAIFGAAQASLKVAANKRRILISAIEHKAVIEPVRQLEAQGFTVTIVPVTKAGILDLDALERSVDDEVALASFMLVNNEVGTIQPIREASAMIHAAGGLVHSDAAQALGKIAIDVLDLDVDYLSLSAHKAYGPMGIGALFVSATAPRPSPQLLGGGQQSGLRPGTEPVPLIAGFGAAARVAQSRLPDDGAHGRRLIELLLEELRARQVPVSVVTQDAPTIPGAAALYIAGVDADMLCGLVASEVSISTSSACTAGQLRTSHVLEAIGFFEPDARSIFRLFCNRYNRETEIIAAAGHIVAAIDRCSLATGGVHQ